ncbi:MAG TPA: beta-N-acetylhexosaminidase, partial [Aquaticitalea sp.]|nr:beta-N-acetylhexosaminidase [Aquaticitalea sp.]
MRFKKIVCLFVFIRFLSISGFAQMAYDAEQIIPVSLHHSFTEGQFQLDSSTGIHYENGFKIAADFLKSYIEDGSDIQLQQNHAISFIQDKNIQNPEGYILEIRPAQIKISAKSDRAAFYAVQTLRQLLPVALENSTFAANEIHLKCQTIEDAPQFPYRGMHLDVARHMFPVDFIKKYIDALALLKFNTFHWHLTDDQGWRIEIKKYPKLQEIAAYRNETLIGHYNTDPQEFDGKRYGGFYTQEEIKDVVAYAEKRFVTIIPEIEMPGHSQAAISAYPELGCTGKPVEAATKWGVFEKVYCTKEETFTFLENVLDEVLELFPSKYIHIGGDEAPKAHWKACSVCQQNIKNLSLKDEHELQSYFISRIEKYLNDKGRNIIGWDEILEGGLAPNATVMSWRGTNGAIEAAKQHHNVILTPNSHLYFDYYQSDKEDEPLAIGGYIPLEKVYGYNPIPSELTVEQSEYVLGAQANLWT